MKFDYLIQIKDYNLLAIIGYIIVCDNHIHSYELKVLDLFIKDKKLGEDAYNIINNILNDKDDKVTFNNALLALEKESVELQKEIIFLLMCIRDVDENKHPKENEIIEICINTCNLNKLDLESFKDDIRNLINNINEEKKTYNNKKKNILVNLINIIKKLIEKIFNRGNYKEDGIELKYNKTIELCKKIAENDFEYITPIYKNIDNHLANYIADLERISLDIKNINTGINKNTHDEADVIV